MKPSGATVQLAVFAIVLSTFTDFAVASQGIYSHVIIESCRGCQLNRLPEVKAFIFEDVPLYENVVFKHIQGAPPEMVLYNESEEEVERLPLKELTREECNKLLSSKGFKQSKIIKDEI